MPQLQGSQQAVGVLELRVTWKYSEYLCNQEYLKSPHTSVYFACQV